MTTQAKKGRQGDFARWRRGISAFKDYAAIVWNPGRAYLSEGLSNPLCGPIHAPEIVSRWRSPTTRYCALIRIDQIRSHPASFLNWRLAEERRTSNAQHPMLNDVSRRKGEWSNGVISDPADPVFVVTRSLAGNLIGAISNAERRAGAPGKFESGKRRRAIDIFLQRENLKSAAEQFRVQQRFQRAFS